LGLGENIYSRSPVWLQNLFVSAYGYRWKHRRFGGVFHEEYIKAKERENFTTQQWINYENIQLQKILLHAFEHVPYYKESFVKHGVNKETLQKISTATLSQLPILSKENLRKYGTNSLIADKKETGGEFFASSGSTGTPTQILFSHAMHQRWMALFERRVRNWAGVSSFIPRGMIGGRRVSPTASSKPPFYRYNFFEKQVYFSAYHINAKNADDYLKGILRYGVQYMTGYAMSNFFLARFFKKENLQAPQLKAVITSSEKLTGEMRETFKEVYNCKTYDSWSGVEACGLITECEYGSLHVSPDAGLIEVLNNNLQPVKAGEAGEVYCTGFINYDQPLIRYAIGDSISFSDKTCQCGRAMPVVQEILGRNEDVIVGKDGREMVRFHSIFNGMKSVRQAQVIQEDVENITIKIVAEGKPDSKEEQIMRERIISQLGEINIRFECVEDIPLNKNGKFRAVVSKLTHKNLFCET
jgi:phenylacetate-CoA ligase